MPTLYAASALLLAVPFGPTVGHAQGDPARTVDDARRPGTAVRIDLIGDSTQTLRAGYGRGFCANLSREVDCLDLAKGGASTRTYREQGLWSRALATRPDYMLLQFGHNDMESAAPNPRQTTLPEYETNLRRFVTEARAAGIQPILVTPLSRRSFGPDGKVHSDLTAHAQITINVADEMHVPLIDLQAQSIALLNTLGERRSDVLAITKKDENGKTIFDKTHLSWAGSYVFGRIVAKTMGEEVPALQKYVLAEAAKLPPAGLKAMKILEGGPVRIVLVGDSTVATGGGWGPGFCAAMTANVTCLDLALNGRSSKSFLDEGAWQKALAEHADFYLIQFGHNDQKPDPARHTDPDTTFETNLQRYVSDAELQGAVPVLVTSLSRRTFKDGKVVQDLDSYAQATREVGARDGITVIDLNRLSTELLDHMSQTEADAFDATGHADAVAENKAEAGAAGGAVKLDRTHLNPRGQALFGRMVADALVRTEVELGPDVKGEAAGASIVPSFAPRQPTPTDGH